MKIDNWTDPSKWPDMDIPKQIKILSIIFFLNAGVALLIGGLTFFSMIYAALGRGKDLTDLSAGFSGVVLDFGPAFLTTILAVILLIFLGFSLRKLKPWARTITLAYSILTIFLGVVGLLTGDRNLSYHFIIQIYAVWVLTRPAIQEAFQTKIDESKDPVIRQDKY